MSIVAPKTAVIRSFFILYAFLLIAGMHCTESGRLGGTTLGVRPPPMMRAAWARFRGGLRAS